MLHTLQLFNIFQINIFKIKGKKYIHSKKIFTKIRQVSDACGDNPGTVSES